MALEEILEAVQEDARPHATRRSHARIKKEQRKGTPEQRRTRTAERVGRNKKGRLGRRERCARKLR